MVCEVHVPGAVGELAALPALRKHVLLAKAALRLGGFLADLPEVLFLAELAVVIGRLAVSGSVECLVLHLLDLHKSWALVS